MPSIEELPEQYKGYGSAYLFVACNNSPVSMEELARALSCSSSTLGRATKLMGISGLIGKGGSALRAERTRVTEALKDEVVELYQELSVGQVANRLGIAKSTAWRILDERDVEIRGTQRTYDVADDFFKVVDTEEKAYWLGFLTADGSVRCHKGSHQIRLTLGAKDENHVGKFRDAVSPDRTVKVVERDRSKNDRMDADKSYEAVLSITSEQMHDDLIERWGGRGRTSDRLVPDVGRDLRRHLWRGLVDGDGGVRIHRNRLVLDFSGSKERAKEFVQFAKGVVGSESSLTRVAGGTYQPGYYGTKAERLARYLYSDSTISLQRKLHALEAWLGYGVT